MEASDQFKPSIVECNFYTGIEIAGETKILVQHIIAAKKSPEKYDKILEFYGPRDKDPESSYGVIKKYSLQDLEQVKLDKFFMQKIKTDKYKIYITRDMTFINQYFSNKVYEQLKQK